MSSRPKRIRISYFALLATTTCAALRKESHMQIIKATGLDRKSGGAQWRDLRFSRSFLEMFFDRSVSVVEGPAVLSRGSRIQSLDREKAPVMVTKEILLPTRRRPQNRTTVKVESNVGAVSPRWPCLALHRRALPVHLPLTTRNISVRAGSLGCRKQQSDG